jgi:TolB protein
MQRVGRLIMIATLVVGCGGTAATPTTPQPTAPSSAAPTPGSTTVTTPAATRSTAPSPTAHPGDGEPDPDGRIAFGRIVGEDDFFGQVIAIWAVDPDGSDLVQLNDGDSGYPAWSPDGSRLAFTQQQPDGTWQIATMAPDGSDVQVLTSGLGADGASWSPDGRWIAFNRNETTIEDPDFHTTIWRMDADGSNPVPLGDQAAFDLEPRISPDGTEFLFERLSFPGGEQRQELIVRNIETGAERVVVDAEYGVEHANWSPDGIWIIYDASPRLGGSAPNDQVERIKADGSGTPEVLFEGTARQGGFKPWYSPDGSRIVFGCFRGGPSSSDAACLMDADGSNVEYLIDSPIHENHFSWGPPTSERQ